MLIERVPNLQHIFDYECINIVIHGGDHFSRVFVMNALKALEKRKSQNDNKEHVLSILLCNSWSPSGVHKKETVSKFVITFLNYIRRQQMQNCTKQHTATSSTTHYHQFFKKHFLTRILLIHNQTDGWSCGYHSLLARRNFLRVLSDKKIMNYDFYENNTEKTKLLIEKMLDGEFTKISKSLLHIVKFLAKDVTTLTPAQVGDEDVDLYTGASQQ